MDDLFNQYITSLRYIIDDLGGVVGQCATQELRCRFDSRGGTFVCMICKYLFRVWILVLVVLLGVFFM